MALISLLPKLAVAVVALLVTRRVYWELTTGARRRAFAKQHGCLAAKKEPGNPFGFGLDILMADIKAIKNHNLLPRWHKILLDAGDAHMVYFSFRGKKIFFTDSPEILKTVLATKFDTYSIGEERIKMLTPLVGKGIFTTDGAPWKHSRGLLRPCFERSQVADVTLLEKHVRKLIEVIPKDGSTIDMQPIFHDLTMDIATEFLFGRSTNMLEREGKDPEAEEFKAAFEYCMNPFEGELYTKWGWLAIFLPDKQLKRSAKIIQAFAGKIIDAEIAFRGDKAPPSPDRYILLQELLSLDMPREQVRSELLQILLAGRDTTASLLSNLLFELPRHPAILSRLRAEIAEYVGDSTPTFEQLKNMKYLQAVMNESQRLYPVVPSNSREAIEDTVIPLGGGPDAKAPVFVPKGSMIAWHTWSLHRREDIYGADSASFNPSRWLDNENPDGPLRPGWGYLPFNGGPRVCIGQQFALTEVAYVLVRLLQGVGEVESRDPEEWREKLTFVCRGLGGCKVSFTEKGSA
ncbi:N-alkane-inducible cytochrome P450 [Amniculicola lignicola CBS 123094]|uniref:N-alkane-inducible cytochrome P450 n=1 Tax=Amniculicola lignicola CBS 123094 TaxID=1392246 RepID=A0A6A5WWG3_9PLEO|nr:N-alkane-inducible cytochrome P450 [Amniculicola lignicola CBS 123094]